MNKRDIKLDKYGISKKRYKELCGFCEQYPEWKQQLESYTLLSSPQITDMPIAHKNTDKVGDMAVRLDGLGLKCALIEDTAKQASVDYAEYIIKSVCYEVPINYLIMCDGLTLSKSSFYRIRRLFFYLLDQNKH